MKRAIVAILSCAFVVSCQAKSINEMSYAEAKQYVATLIDRCQKEGVRSKSEMEVCVRQEAGADAAKREKLREFGRALQAAGAAMEASRPRTTSCSGFGNMVTCNTY